VLFTYQLNYLALILTINEVNFHFSAKEKEEKKILPAILRAQ